MANLAKLEANIKLKSIMLCTFYYVYFSCDWWVKWFWGVCDNLGTLCTFWGALPKEKIWDTAQRISSSSSSVRIGMMDIDSDTVAASSLPQLLEEEEREFVGSTHYHCLV